MVHFSWRCGPLYLIINNKSTSQSHSVHPKHSGFLCLQRPSIRVGHTSFIADSRGHLFPGVKASASNHFLCFCLKQSLSGSLACDCVVYREAAPGRTLRALGIFQIMSQPITSTNSSHRDSAHQRGTNHCQTEAAGTPMLASRSGPQ